MDETWTKAVVERKAEIINAIKEFRSAGEHYTSWENVLGVAIKAMWPQALLEDPDDDSPGESDIPCPMRLTLIDHGHYQGTLVAVVGEGGYQPSKYWACLIGYGSCSGCDSLQAAWEDPPETAAQEVYTLILHVAQKMAPVPGGW